MLYPARALSQLGSGGVDLRETISEMAPLRNSVDSLATTIAVYHLSLIWAVLWIVVSWGRVSGLRILLWLVSAWAAWESQRALGFYALAFVLVHTGYRCEAALWWRRFGALQRCATWLTERRVVLALVVAALAVAVTFAAVWVPAIARNDFYLAEGVARRFGRGLTPAHYPVAAAEALARTPNASDSRIANNLDAAGYLIGRRAGKVMIDGRTEVYPAAVWRDYRRFRRGGPDAMTLLRNHRADWVCLMHRNAIIEPLLRTLLADTAWELTLADEAGVLFQPARTSHGAATADAILGRACDSLLTALPGPAHGYRGPGGTTGAADRCVALAGLLDLAGLAAEAERLLLRGLLYRPDHWALNHNYGNVLLHRRDYAAAASRFARAARANRRAAGARINLGVCYFHLGRLHDAQEALEAAVSIDPRRGGAWANLAEIRRRLGDRSGALKAYARAIALRPNDQNLRGRATRYEQAGRR
jgi:hypothetical protein